MKHKQLEDEALVLKVNEWHRILSENDISTIKGIINSALHRRDKTRKNRQIQKEKVNKKAKELSRSRLRGKAEEFRADLIKHQTPSECKLKIILKELGIKYEFQKIFYTETSFYIADFYLPNYNIIIEVDGNYHDTTEQVKKDNERTTKLIEDIDGVYRIRNGAVSNTELAKSIVREFLTQAKMKNLNERVNKLYER